eukprot:jgi/Botrbrau1/9397/Bobra.0252s0022.1
MSYRDAQLAKLVEIFPGRRTDRLLLALRCNGMDVTRAALALSCQDTHTMSYHDAQLAKLVEIFPDRTTDKLLLALRRNGMNVKRAALALSCQVCDQRGNVALSGIEPRTVAWGAPPQWFQIGIET